MLLDAIIWLPTLFTYILFLLILIILFFIVAYVSHKIYISIYDNLPLPAAPGSRYSLSISPHRVQSTRSEAVSARSIWIQNRSQIYESSVEVACQQFALYSRWRPAIWSASSWTSIRIPPSVPLASCATASRTSISVPPSLPERGTVCACSSTTITCPGCHALRFCCAATSARICAWCSTTSSRM
ncbi:uncharacterized protein LOC115563141 isoform X2 [Drosophila navojoa]|uniref:uncharacterized protein LOC115563141 isoform X2 n=1 Tax=Drosophila navojoa TaxID=7232 RepID=UPI0011BD583E|nr:uncharacterized protein LOC115563141 isoform X2 [Drosophila navojoa]